ncbi:Selenide, water dikinase [Roseivivax sp. THAF40]|uniref:selenide, water dikinase SelD n=1 Tax=unclassified Roseivivax TaxID=2639302 RepID=UPI001267996E|nr:MULTISPECIES: selenide, water dikinase SelD [unclassified Roseivivax]QFS82612.1 Selenide, water dikinase [Roseivivax sp. THAF197b]QFT46380.1 Selenide, water dikinase [Roseivivax sp. THAF40]
MHQPPLPLTRDLVLVGGGHTHALVLRKWGMDPLPGARLTLIDPTPVTAYSGMLPGFVAGHFTREELDIDLVKLARFAGARLILGPVTGIDPARKLIEVPGRPPVAYDVCSLDVGITSAMPDLPGFSEHAVPAKPLGPFADRWTAFLDGTGPARVAVIGGGVAGCELAMAMAHALYAKGRAPDVTIIDRSQALSGLDRRTERGLRAALEARGVTLKENCEISELTSEGVQLAEGTFLTADFIVGAAGAKPHDWIAAMGLDHQAGFLSVSARLQSSDPAIFAAGDCAHLAHAPRPKAGVFAVRAAPILYSNLRAALGGGTWRRFEPQSDYLKLISLGRQSALGARFGLFAQGEWVWRWKDRIDRRFMEKLSQLPHMTPPPLPAHHASGLAEARGPKPMCGGCGAKVGRATLARALSTLPKPDRTDIVPLPGDDAALLHMGATRQVLTTDHLRAVTLDPVVMTRIAAHHALGDIHAMGAAPQAATLNLNLPRLSDQLSARMLTEIVTTASEVLRASGAEIVGGHSSVGDELTIGFSLTGLAEAAPITLSGGQAGDVLILTKPIGSGTILAAEMQGQASGHDVAACWEWMCQDQSGAARILADAHAMTDVTGFGLIGHAQNMAEASGCGLALSLSDIPWMQGALALADAGHRSSLYPQNREVAPDLPETARHALLFDPQTSGGLLAAVSSENAAEQLKALRNAGFAAAEVGHLTARPGAIEVRT